MSIDDWMGVTGAIGVYRLLSENQSAIAIEVVSEFKMFWTAVSSDRTCDVSFVSDIPMAKVPKYLNQPLTNNKRLLTGDVGLNL